MLAALLGLVVVQDGVSPDLLEYRPSGRLAGTLEVGPGGGFENLLTLWSAKMKEHHPDLRGGQPGPSWTTTPQALIKGTCRLGLLARRWTDTELEDFQFYWGYSPVQLAVGADAVAVVVHPENPIRDLLLADVDAIFSSTRRRGGKPVRIWGNLGLTGEWNQRPINLYGPGKDSPARSAFVGRALQGGSLREGIKELPDAKSVLLAVAEDPCGIGYVNAAARTEELRALPVRPSADAPAVELQPETVVSLSYPLAWRIYMSVRKVPGRPLEPQVGEFLKMILSRDGQVILAAEGLVPVTGRFARKELSKLK